MADPSLLTRLARRLQAASESTPKGEGFWPAMAAIAAAETERTIGVTLGPVPQKPFYALAAEREGLVVIGQGALLADVSDMAMTYFQEGGIADVSLVEVKRVLVRA